MTNDLIKPEHVDTLRQFSIEFQSKVISVLLTDLEFLQKIYDILTPHYFESEANKWIVKTIIEYYKEYKNVPSMEVFKVELNKVENQSVLRVAIIEQLRIVYRHVSSNDMEYIKDTFLEFCKNQAIKNAILESANLLQRKDFSKIKVLIDKAMQAGMERSVGHEWQKDLNLRIADSARNVVPTDWTPINKLLDGGLGRGELGVVMAPSGQGKSWSLVSLGVAALRAGKRVVYYSMELSEYYVGLRFDTMFSGIESKKIKDNVEHIRIMLDSVPGNLIVKYFPSGVTTTDHLSAHLNHLIQQNRKPDLVLVDYGDLMRSTRSYASKHEELGGIYEELRAMAAEMDCALWTCSQTQRSSLQDDVIGADRISSSFAKVFTADFIISLSRKLEDRINGTGRMHVIKNRNGSDGAILMVKLDFQHGEFKVYESDSAEGTAVANQIKQGSDFVKKLFKQSQPAESW